MLDYLEDLITKLKTSHICDFTNNVFSLIADTNSNPVRMIMIDSELYRARKIENVEEINRSTGFYGYDSNGSFVNPNTTSIKPMRANKAGQARLYCSNVSYLPLVEVHPYPGEQISLATIKNNSILKLLDLTLYHINFEMPEEKKQLFKELSDLFALPVNNDDDKDDYLITQEIADYVCKLGYDGIAYSSSLVPVLNSENYNGANYVIFNYLHCVPTHSNVVQMLSKPSIDNSNFDFAQFIQVDKDPNRLVLITCENNTYNFHFTFGEKADNTIKNSDGINRNVFVSASKTMFDIPVRITTTGKITTAKVGEMMTFFIEPHKPTTIQLRMSNKLNSQINDLMVLLLVLQEGKIWFGDRQNTHVGSFDINLSASEYQQDIENYKKQLILAHSIKKDLLTKGIYVDYKFVKPINSISNPRLIHIIPVSQK